MNGNGQADTAGMGLRSWTC